jgi:hypothetical protein
MISKIYQKTSLGKVILIELFDAVAIGTRMLTAPPVSGAQRRHTLDILRSFHPLNFIKIALPNVSPGS